MLFDDIERTATIGTTEYSIVNGNTSGVASATTEAVTWLVVDRSAMAAGDEFLIQVYEKAVSGGTQRVAQRYTLRDTGTIDVLGPVPLRNGYDWTAKKISGTDRSLDMSLRREVSSPTVAEVQSGLATAAGVTAATAPLATTAGVAAAVAPLATSAGVTSVVAPLATTAQVAALPSAGTVADAVWDEPRSAHVGAGSFGEGVIVSALANGAITAASIASDAITAAKVAADVGTEIAAAVLAAAVEGSRTVAQTLRGLWSLGLTKASGFDTGTVVLRDAADSKNRMTIVTGSTGRTSITVGDLD